MSSNIDLMMNTEIQMLVFESKCFNNFIRRMTFSKSDDGIKTVKLTVFLFDHENLSFQSKVKKCIETIRMRTRSV